jgi:ABC-type phosphate transport system auxiliary subunit
VSEIEKWVAEASKLETELERLRARDRKRQETLNKLADKLELARAEYPTPMILKRIKEVETELRVLREGGG